MFHMHAADWAVGREDPNADRDRAHRMALRDARITTEYRTALAAERGLGSVATQVRPSVVARLRLAIAGGTATPTADLSACCA